MKSPKDTTTAAPVTGSVLEDDDELTLEQLCKACAVDAERIVEYVQEGVLDPRGRETRRWRFSAVSLHRVQVVRRLQRDLDVNLPGAGLILDLMDEIEALRRELNRHGVTPPEDDKQ